jgi:hypothetical protein
LMDIHHDTYFRAILEYDSISSASRACIHFCSGKGARLWLVVTPSICLFRITHFTFTSMMHLRLSLIKLLASSLFMCKCGHRLDKSSTHLAHCMFGGQRITTHDAIRNIMYVFIRNNGHVVWREQWYVILSKVSLQVDFYITHED